MFNNVPKFRVQLRRVNTSNTVKGKQIVNSAWLLDEYGYLPLFYMIDSSKLTLEKFMKLVSNINEEFIKSNITSIVFEDDILSNSIIDELCETIKLFIMFRFVFALPTWSLRVVSFKNTPYKFSKLILSDMSFPIIELSRRDIVDVDCKPEVVDENGGKIIVSGKVKLWFLDGSQTTVNFLFNEFRNTLIIDDKDLSRYIDVIKNPMSFYRKFLEDGVVYYEHKITNYMSDEHETYTILFKISDITEHNRAMTLFFKDEILGKVYKKNIKVRSVVENDTSFVINGSIVVGKSDIFNLNPNLYRVLSNLAEMDSVKG